MNWISKEFLLFLILSRLTILRIKCSKIEIDDPEKVSDSNDAENSVKAWQSEGWRQNFMDEPGKFSEKVIVDHDEHFDEDEPYDLEVLRRIGEGELFYFETEERPSLTLTEDVTTVDGSTSTVNTLLARSRKFSIDEAEAVKSRLISGAEKIEEEAEEARPSFLLNLPVTVEDLPDFLTPTVISETCSVSSDYELQEEDCFDGWAVHRVSMNWIMTDLIPYLRSEKRLSLAKQLEILELAKCQFANEAPIINLKIESDQVLFVVGDIHGQFEDLIKIFDEHGPPSSQRIFLFNGDIVDRGPSSIECLLTLFMMKIVSSNSVFITRGNHESHSCGPGTFRDECFTRTNDPHKVFNACHDVFNHLPLGYIIKDKFFVCHGGLPEELDLAEIGRARKPDYTILQQCIMMSMLWNDPHEGLGMRPSSRGGSTLSFGCDVTMNFLLKYNFYLLIRSHEFHKNGYFFSHNNQCLTVFSAPNYCGLGNRAVVMKIFPDLRYDIIPIDVFLIESSPLTLRRSKERSLTLNLEDTDFLFNSELRQGKNPVVEQGENQRVPTIDEGVEADQLNEDEREDTSSSTFASYISEFFSLK